MDQKTDSTNTEIAKAGITQAAAEGQPGATAPAESGVAPPTKVDSAFASEDAELDKALAEQAKVEAEAKGKVLEKGATATDGTGTTTGQGTAAAKEGEKTATVAGATAAAAAAGHNASTAAIVALRHKLSEIQGALLVKEGENRVLKTLVDPEKFATEAGETGAVAREPTAEEQELQALGEESDRISSEVDAGRLTMLEYNQQLRDIRKLEQEISFEQTRQMIADAAQPVNDLGLQEHVGSLVQRFPLMGVLTAAQLQPYERSAYDQAAAEGKPIQAGPVGTKDLRERMAALATADWETRLGVKIPAQGGTGASATTGSVSTVRTLPNAAEREAKLALAGNHPPDIGKTGAGDQGGGPTDAQAMAALSGDEDAGIAWLKANPGFVLKTVGKSARF